MNQAQTLKNRNALVTGSTSGIGLGIAKALAEQGANLIINGFGEGETLAQQLAQTYGIKVKFHGADLSDVAQIEAMFAFAQKEFKHIDILVNNAGIQHVAAVEEFPVERWDAVLAINLSAVFHTTRLALPAMKQAHWGRIINIASVHGLTASIQKAAYVAAKHGVVGLTKVVALETAQTGVTCNAICPGWVLTPLVQKQVDARALKDQITQDEAKHRLVSEKQPSAEFVSVEQLAALAIFLCSEAATQVRGAAWNMDGGRMAQ